MIKNKRCKKEIVLCDHFLLFDERGRTKGLKAQTTTTTYILRKVIIKQTM